MHGKRSLIINPGSTSLKYALFEEGKQIKKGGKESIEALQKHLQDTDEIILRVVHGGPYFTQPIQIDKNHLEKLRSISSLAPLHNPISLQIIEYIQSQTDVDIWAVFDTGFHATIPTYASTYALPKKITEKYHIKKYGFHGISHQYVSQQVREKDPTADKIISLHLGGGGSITAIKNGISIDTSMGFTPVSGIIMKTRSGNIDPSIITYLIEHAEMNSEQIHTMLNSESGIKGLTEKHLDSRELTTLAQEGNKQAAAILDMYVYSIIQYIGSYYAVLGGLDALIFTGGIGENNEYIRNKICEQLSVFDLHFESGLQKKSSPDSKVSVWIIPTNEEQMMFELVQKEQKK